MLVLCPIALTIQYGTYARNEQVVKLGVIDITVETIWALFGCE